MKSFLLLLLVLFLFLLTVLLISPNTITAQERETVNLPNPLGEFNVETPGDLIAVGLAGFAGVIAAVAIVFTVFNGFKLVVAGATEPGKDEKRNEAKRGLLWSVGGFLVAILSFTIISGVAQILGFDVSKTGQEKEILESPLTGPANTRELISVLNFVMTNFLGLLGFAATATIIYYGYRYITAAGNEDEIKKAKDGLKWAIIGFVVTISAFAIITLIRDALFSIPTS